MFMKAVGSVLGVMRVELNQIVLGEFLHGKALVDQGNDAVETVVQNLIVLVHLDHFVLGLNHSAITARLSLFIHSNSISFLSAFRRQVFSIDLLSFDSLGLYIDCDAYLFAILPLKTIDPSLTPLLWPLCSILL
jgi:hypothetical protein